MISIVSSSFLTQALKIYDLFSFSFNLNQSLSIKVLLLRGTLVSIINYTVFKEVNATEYFI